MWRSMEEVVLRELKEEGIIVEDEQVKSEKTEDDGLLPPGFRFHPTDEELITYYLASKVFTSTTTTNNNSSSNNAANLLLSSCYSGVQVQIAEVDLTRCEPWDLPQRAKMGEREWYLYSLRDRKYPSGLRTNRATETGYWKATGKDRQVYGSSITTAPPAIAGGGGGGLLIGMKKTLVFYHGRAPRGVKTKWVMHEYRLDGHFSSFRLSSKEEWVICRIFHKNGDKKNQAIMHHPPPLTLSPFLSTLLPLQELKPSTTTTTTALTTPTVADNNSLLHSLLSNPLPNFSSISGSHPIFPPPTTTSVDIPWLSPTNAATSTTTASAAAAVSAAAKQQNWLDRICPQVQIQYFQHQYQYHDHDHHHNQPMILDQTVNICPLPNTSSDHHDDTAAVHVDVGAGALDRMLNHSISYHPAAESWSFHYP